MVTSSSSTEPVQNGAAHVEVRSDGAHALVHLPQVAGNRDFVHRDTRICAAFHPEAGGAARIVAGHAVDALPHQFRDDTGPMPMAASNSSKPCAPMPGTDLQVVDAAGIAGGLAVPACAPSNCPGCSPGARRRAPGRDHASRRLPRRRARWRSRPPDAGVPASAHGPAAPACRRHPAGTRTCGTGWSPAPPTPCARTGRAPAPRRTAPAPCAC